MLIRNARAGTHALLSFVLACSTAAVVGCGADATRTRRLPASVFHAARLDGRHARASRPTRPPAPTAAARASRDANPAAALVERALHAAGLRFGTDGSTRALWGYLRTSHELVPPAEARPGDVIFFDVWGTDGAPACADHAGLVESVDPDGRIEFVELRAGSVRRSFAHAALPTARRDAEGRVLNTFLRPMSISEPPGARHFAGEMICGVARVSR